MSKIQLIIDALQATHAPQGLTATDLASQLNLDRSSISRYLNQLTRDGLVTKITGKPVYFQLKDHVTAHIKEPVLVENKAFEQLVGSDMSLSTSVQQAKAAMLYPPRGLHTLILGETGVGKSLFAEMMYQFAIAAGMLDPKAPFIRFNCADYADNPQLLMAQIFGVKKGAFTGANEDRVGLLKRADQGVLFLDEVHRLSSQGQEMLFTFIDKGVFRRLGDTDTQVSADVQLIAATTEEPNSVLLKTFMRRIPMTITLPSLRDRELLERYQLIEWFLKSEASRLQKSIYVNRNSLASMLLYECPANIGQLKSDLQLACAKAFLRYKTVGDTVIMINQGDLPQHVSRGLMRLKEKRDGIDKLLNPTDDLFQFSIDQNQNIDTSSPRDTGFFYDVIERKMTELQDKGMDEQAIKEILNIDIEDFFQNYIDNLPQRLGHDELLKIVDQDIMDMTKRILDEASSLLKRTYDERLYFGLCLHLMGSVDRIKSGKKIYHPKLNQIRLAYEEEFKVALEAARMIDQTLHIITPLDEVGYLTMFLASDRMDERLADEDLVGLLVIMHGSSTATSMAGVANSLLATTHTKALDMPLSMSAESMYALAKEEVIRMDRGKGVLLLVDMGSLTNFGNLIMEETGITVRTIDMVSTAVVLEACRKAVLGRDIYEIHKSLRTEIQSFEQATQKTSKKKIIITACFTGEGASKTLREIVEKRLSAHHDIEIKTLNILNKKDFVNAIQMYSEAYRILCIISTVQIEVQGYTFIPAIDFMTGKADPIFNEVIETENVFVRVAETIGQHVEGLDATRLVTDILNAIDRIEQGLKMTISYDVKLGILLHMAFMINRLRLGGDEVTFGGLPTYLKTYQKEMIVIQEGIMALENHYGVYIGASEQAYLCRMFIENHMATP